MAEVPEAEGSPAEVLETAVDRLCRSVAGAGTVEERQDVGGSLLEGAAELADLDERRGNTDGDRVDKQGIGVDRMYREMVTLGHQPPRIVEEPGPRVRARLGGRRARRSHHASDDTLAARRAST